MSAIAAKGRVLRARRMSAAAMTTSASGELRARLRIATREAHRRLELALDLLNPEPDRAHFFELLKHFYGFYGGWEAGLSLQSPADAAWLMTHSSVAHLVADLRALGFADDDIATLPRCPIPESLFHSAGATSGSLYVIEGSMLGSAVIGRHLAKCEWVPAAGFAYFNPYREDTARRWKAMLDRLDECPVVHWPEVEQGALETFALLEKWLMSNRRADATR